MEARRAAFEVLNIQIERIERTVLRALKPRKDYQMLLTVDEIGPVIAWIILLETGDLSRFKNVGQFASYARCVDSKMISKRQERQPIPGEGSLRQRTSQSSSCRLRGVSIRRKQRSEIRNST